MGTIRARSATQRGARREGGQASASAYHRLHALIVSGVLAPGSPLVERDLCTRLGVSRTPVRAALLRLQQDGLVRGTPAGGGGRAVVAPLTSDDLREIFLMAGALEATAARTVAGLGAAPRATVGARLDKANRGLRAAIAGRPPSLVEAQGHHRRFHRACIDQVAGPRLRAEIAGLSPQVERYERVYSAALIYAIDEFAGAHDAIIAALCAGDADAAERAVAADWRLAADRHGEMLSMLGERGSW
jgi:DNA-binding GntR family transcriptional regulator